MPTDISILEEQITPTVSPGNYSPVTVYNKDTVGATFLGILAVILLIAWLRSEKRYRRLIQRWHRGAVNGTSQAYYHEWIEYEGRHALRPPNGIGATDGQITQFLEEWQSGEFAVEMFWREFDKLLERCEHGYCIKTDGKVARFSRISPRSYPKYDSKRERTDGLEVDEAYADDESVNRHCCFAALPRA